MRVSQRGLGVGIYGLRFRAEGLGLSGLRGLGFRV